jgi:flagellar protein FlaG
MDIQQVSSQVASQFANIQSDIKVAPPVSAPDPVAPSPAPKAADAVAAPVVTAEQVAHAVAQVNQVIQHFNPDIEFTVDPTTKIDVVRVVDKANGQVIRQFPSDAILGMAQVLDKLQGLLVRHRI